MTTDHTTTTKKYTNLWLRAVRAEERAIEADASDAAILRAAKASDRARRALDCVIAGLPVPVAAAPRTRRNLIKGAFAAIASIGVAVARATTRLASLAKARTAATAARAVRTARRIALRGARRAIAAIVAIVFAVFATTTAKETTMIATDTNEPRPGEVLFVGIRRKAGYAVEHYRINTVETFADECGRSWWYCTYEPVKYVGGRWVWDHRGGLWGVTALPRNEPKAYGVQTWARAA